MTLRRAGALLALLVLSTACSAATKGGTESDAATGSGSPLLESSGEAPRDLPGEIEFASPVTSNVTVDASSDGRTVAVGWYAYDDASAVEQALVAVSTDGGATFGDPTVVAEPAVQFPDVAVLDDGTILVGTITYDGSALIDPSDQLSWPGWPVIYRSTDHGTTFQMMADLRDTIGDRVLVGGMPTSLAASGVGNTIVFSYQDKTPPAFVPAGEPARDPDSAAMPTYAVVSLDGGATFLPPQPVGPSTCGCCQSTAFVAGERAGVAMRLLDPVSDLSDERDPGLNIAGPDGTFGDPIEIHDDQYQMPLDGCPASGPAVAEANGIVHTAWWTGVDGRKGWWYAKGESVTSLGEPVALDAEYTITYSVHIAAASDGAAWVLGMHWPDDTGGFHLWVWRVDASGTPTLTDVAPPVDPAAQSYDITALEDGALMAWMSDGSVHVAPVTA